MKGAITIRRMASGDVAWGRADEADVGLIGSLFQRLARGELGPRRLQPKGIEMTLDEPTAPTTSGTDQADREAEQSMEAFLSERLLDVRGRRIQALACVFVDEDGHVQPAVYAGSVGDVELLSMIGGLRVAATLTESHYLTRGIGARPCEDSGSNAGAA